MMELKKNQILGAILKKISQSYTPDKYKVTMNQNVLVVSLNEMENGNQNTENQFDEYMLNTFRTFCQNKKTIVFDMDIDDYEPTEPPKVWKLFKDLPNLLLHSCVGINKKG